jgi:hypothetical protein
LFHRLFEAEAADLEVAKEILESNKGATLACNVVRLRGVPYSANALHIRHFLHGLQLANIPEPVEFIYLADGRPSGEVFVHLADAEAVQAALQRHKEMLGHRYVEVFPSSQDELAHARRVSSSRMQQLMLQAAIPQNLGGYQLPLGAGVSSSAYIAGPHMRALPVQMVAAHARPFQGERHESGYRNT